MAEPRKRTTQTLSRGCVEAAQAMGLNMSAIAEAAIARAVAQARAEAWAAEHASALRAQDEWLAREGHPFADAVVGPFAPTRNGDGA
ncbi:MAG: type II toxin-antitoxin system CcdA family antitoxin [Rubrimonas sp.]